MIIQHRGRTAECFLWFIEESHQWKPREQTLRHGPVSLDLLVRCLHPEPVNGVPPCLELQRYWHGKVPIVIVRSFLPILSRYFHVTEIASRRVQTAGVQAEPRIGDQWHCWSPGEDWQQGWFKTRVQARISPVNCRWDQPVVFGLSVSGCLEPAAG